MWSGVGSKDMYKEYKEQKELHEQLAAVTRWICRVCERTNHLWSITNDLIDNSLVFHAVAIRQIGQQLLER